MKKILILFLITGLFLINCGNRKTIDLKLSKKGDFPVISLNNSNLDKPLKILSAADKGSFYFKTADGIQWINGQPDNRKVDKSKLVANWTVDNIKVTMIAEQKSEDFLVKFSAEPDDDILGWGLNIQAEPDEFFTGLFERTVDGNQKESWKPGITEAINMRGQHVDMILKPTLTLYSPFYISSRNYGMKVYGTWPGEYDLCKEIDNIVQVYFDGPSFKAKFYTRKELQDIVKAHSLEVGPTIVPPKWVFSHWCWRDDHDNNAEYYDGTIVNAPYNSMLVEDILMMEALDIPCGLYWIDRPWAKKPMGYGDFEWNPNRFPYAEDMIKWINDKGMEVMLWIAPWVAGDMAHTAVEKGYVLPRKVNKWTTWALDNNLQLIDFTNPEAVKWWQENGPEKVLKQGIKGFKLDRSEELVPESRDIIAHDGRTTRELRNAYPVEYVKATYKAAKKIHGDDFVLMPRAGYPGSSKYGVFWGGDIGAPEEGLRAAIIAYLKSGIIGYPIWGSDIGGYWQAPQDREVVARWLGFGAFCPIMEVGPLRNRGMWNLPDEPRYDPELLATWRTYAMIHTKLMDYSYEHAEIAHESGMPVGRPLFLVYPDQEEAWQDWKSFLYGKDILVSPIWKKGVTRNQLYLPKGETWLDAWNMKQEYKGGQTIEVDAPVYKTPIFIRKGSSVNLGDLNELYRESLEIAKKKPNMAALEEAADFSVE